jgi:hypothetical protein
MPQLSLNQPIDDVESVKNLQVGHPVFLLVAEDGSHLVVKQESTTDAENLRRVQLAMQLASPQARSVILTADEVQVLKSFVDLRRMMARHGDAGPVGNDVNALATYLRMGGTWFKMNEAKGLINLGAVARQVLEGDKSGARAMAKALNASGGLEALGKIVGADLFNANGDRFTPAGGGKSIVQTSMGQHTFNVKTVANSGNVMAALNDGKLKVIGLDSWDPYSEQITDMSGNAGGDWIGGLLAPDMKAERLKYAQDICDDLNLMLGPRNRRFSFLQQTRLNPDAPQRIVKGMESITKKLIAKMEASIKRPQAPAGLASRLKKLRGF